ncbi:terminase small subunit [Mucilaginibacter panaciglaebae]|uniref:Uncharacterized protein n=1 Tax=Mucilaginibacter panaciglaebae TaxID=502331 RepID=A0ABP7WPS2_9SPHI
MARTKYKFNNRASLNRLIDEYFERSKNDTDNTAEPITVTGLALYLGFTSKDAFDEYEQIGYHKVFIQRARFRVMAYYESRLHYPAPTGAMFALKSMGWADKFKASKVGGKAKLLTVKLIESGPRPASAEKEVVL